MNNQPISLYHLGRGEKQPDTAELPIGTRVFNRGDMANLEHWGTITEIIRSERFYDEYRITPDMNAERSPYTVPLISVYTVDKGHGGTRIVTEKAYNEHRNQQIEQMRKV